MDYTKIALPALDAEAEKKLIQRHKDGDKEATDILVRSNIGLVMKIAKKYLCGDASYDDLMQEGILGLIEAIDKFDIEAGTKLSTYATYHILRHVFAAANDSLIPLSRHRIEDRVKIERYKESYMCEHGKEPSDTEISEALGLPLVTIQSAKPVQTVSIEAPVTDDAGTKKLIEDYIEDETMKADPVREAIITALDMLDEKDQKLLKQLYGIDERKRPAAEIAEEKGLSRAAIYLHRDAALRKLRAPKKLQKIKEELRR